MHLKIFLLCKKIEKNILDMKSSIREEIINHDAIKLFEIVLDIENYPVFIPWCSSMNINSRSKNEIFADMYVKYKFIFTQKLGSHVIFDKKELKIQTNYIEGPLKDLKTNWFFESIDKNKTKIKFVVDFEFKSFFHQKIAETLYPLIENKMIESFRLRADEVLN